MIIGRKRDLVVKDSDAGLASGSGGLKERKVEMTSRLLASGSNSWTRDGGDGSGTIASEGLSQPD